MWTFRESFRPLVSTDVCNFAAPVSDSSANQKGKRTSNGEPSVSARGSSRIRIFGSGVFQQDLQGGRRYAAGKVAKGSYAPVKVCRAGTHFSRFALIEKLAAILPTAPVP